MELIAHAYDVAEKKCIVVSCENQVSRILIHPMAVAEILADLGMDEETIIAGLLHDVVEDTSYTEEQLIDEFGEEIGPCWLTASQSSVR